MQHRLIAFIVGFSSSVSCEYFTPAMFYAVIKNDENGVLSAIESGAKVNARDGQNWTALHYAAQKGNAKIIQILVIAHADTELLDDNYMTPFLVAAAEGNGMELLKLLEFGANRKAKNRYGQDAIELARVNNHPQVVKLLQDLEREEQKEAPIEHKVSKSKDPKPKDPKPVNRSISNRAYLLIGAAIGIAAGLRLAKPKD